MYVDVFFVEYNYPKLLFVQAKKNIFVFSFLVFCLYHWLMFGLIR